MATTRGAKGQAAKVFFGVSFTDATGAAVNPSGTPQLKVYRVAEPLELKATLNLSQQAGVTGFWGAFLDISNATTYPAGDYQLLATPTVAAVATVFTDTFEIDETPSGASGGFIAGAYASEAQIRGVSAVLISSAKIPQLLVLEKAVQASRWIDGKLRVVYDVPFPAVYDETITLLTMYLAAADLLDYARGAGDDTVAFAAELRARVDTMIADLIAGTSVLSVDPLVDPYTVGAGPKASTEGLTRVFDPRRTGNILAGY